MYLYPHSNHNDALGLMMLVIAPAVFLLCWLYNAYRLGKFRKRRHAPPNIARKRTYKKGLFVIGCIILAILLGLAARFVF